MIVFKIKIEVESNSIYEQAYQFDVLIVNIGLDNNIDVHCMEAIPTRQKNAQKRV